MVMVMVMVLILTNGLGHGDGIMVQKHGDGDDHGDCIMVLVLTNGLGIIFVQVFVAAALKSTLAACAEGPASRAGSRAQTLNNTSSSFSPHLAITPPIALHLLCISP